MGKMLVVDVSKCTGCDSCVMGCSFKHAGVFRLKARIQVEKIKEEGLFVPIMCQHCINAPCAAVCPSGALRKDHDTGETKLLEHLCIGCRMCLTACPFGAIEYNKGAEHMEKCNLCDGDPVCAVICTAGAISFKEVDITPKNKRIMTAWKQVEARKAEQA